MARHRSPEGRCAHPEVRAALATLDRGDDARPRHALSAGSAGAPALIPAPRESADSAPVPLPRAGFMSGPRPHSEVLTLTGPLPAIAGPLFTPSTPDAPSIPEPGEAPAAGMSPDVDEPAATRTGRFRIPVAARRGAAVVVAAGSALALAATASNLVGPDAGPAAADATLRLDTAAVAETLPAAKPGLAPAAVLDTAAVTEMVQRAQQQAQQQVEAQAAAQAAAQRAAAEQQAAAQREAEARAAAEAAKAKAAAAAAAAGCGLPTSGLGRVKPWVADAAEFLGCLFGRPTMLGVGSRGNASDHPGGLAVDFMVAPAVGDRLAACALRNKDALGISYVIWKQRINYGSGWNAMEDRGGATANHMDHVHVSFNRSAPGGKPVTC